MQDALSDAIGPMDTRHAQTVLTHDRSLRDGAAVAIKELLVRYTATNMYESEVARSTQDGQRKTGAQNPFTRG